MDSKKRWNRVFMGILRRYPSDIDLLHLTGDDLYELDFGMGRRPATDVALNFKFIVPIAAVKLGAGVSAGLTVAEETYMPHMGALGYLSMNIASNLDAFAMVQYKHLVRDIQAVNDVHAHAGLMFRF